MYYSDFPYYQNYYQYYNYIPKYGYNSAFAHQATSSPSCQVGLSKQPQRKTKENTGLPGINGNQGQLASSTIQQNGLLQNSLAIERQDNKESELYKQQIMQWLKSLDIDQRFEVFMIKDKWFAQTIIKMFWKQKTGGDSAFALYSEEDKKDSRNTNKIVELDQQFYCRKCVDHDSASNAPRREAEQEIVRVLRIIDDKEMYDSLVFDKAVLENIDHLIDVFDIISDNNIFQSAHFSQWSWFNQNSFQTIASWIVSQFERMVQFKFLEDRQRYHQKLGRQAQGLITSTSSLQKDNNKSINFAEQANDLKSSSQCANESPNSSSVSESNSSNINNQMSNQQNGNNNNNQTNYGISQFNTNNNSSQENLSHYQNLLAYWNSMNSSKKRKVLNKGSEMHKILSTNSLIDGLEKNDKQLEWYRKKKDQFYVKQKLPNDEEIQQSFLLFLDEAKAEKFIDQLCFTSLEETTSVITIVLKKMHEKLNEMYSEQIAQYLIHNDELEKNFKKKKNNTQNQGNSNGAKKKKKSTKKQKGAVVCGPPPIKEPSFAEEVSLMHQEQLLQEQQESQKQVEKLTQVQVQEEHKTKQVQKQENNQIAQNRNKNIIESSNQLEENSSSLENSKKCESVNTSCAINNKKKTNSNMPLVLKMQQQQKKNEYLEVCCQQNKCEMLDLTKNLAQKLINSCIQGVDTFNSQNEINYEQFNSKTYETDHQSSQNPNTNQSANVATINTSQVTQSKKKKKGKNVTASTASVVNNANSSNGQQKSKKKTETLTENDEGLTDENRENEDEDQSKNISKKDNIKNKNIQLQQNIDGDDTEELPIQNDSDSDHDEIKKGNEIHSDNTTIDCTGEQDGMSSVITISSSSKRKQSDSHNSNSSYHNNAKNINAYSDEDDFKQFKDNIATISNNNTNNNLSVSQSTNKNSQQHNSQQNNKLMSIKSQSEISMNNENCSNTEQVNNNDTNNTRQGMHKRGENSKQNSGKCSDEVVEKDVMSNTTSQYNETICNSSMERTSLISSRSGSQMQITSVYSLGHQNTSTPTPVIDDSDFIQVVCKKKGNKKQNSNQQGGGKNDSRRNMNNQQGNGQNGRKNTNNNNGQNNTNNNMNNNSQTNNNNQKNRRDNRGIKDQQTVQGDNRQNNHQNALRNNRTTNQNQSGQSKTQNSVSEQSQQEKIMIDEDHVSQSTSTHSRYTQKSQTNNINTISKDTTKNDSAQQSIIYDNSTTAKKASTNNTLQLQNKKAQKTEQKPIVVINTIDIISTKEDEVVNAPTQQANQTLNKEPSLPQSASNSISDRKANDQALNNSSEQTESNKSTNQQLNKDQKQPMQQSSISNNAQNVPDPNQNQNTTTLEKQSTSKYSKLTPVKKQKLQIIQKSPLSLNAEKFTVREEYVQKSQLTQQTSQSGNSSNSTTASSSKENGPFQQNTPIPNSSSSSSATTTTTTTTNSSNQKKNQQINNRKKSGNQNSNPANSTENYIASNSQRQDGSNNNFQNQWKDISEGTHAPTTSNLIHNSKTKAKIAKRLFRRKVTNDVLSFTEMVNVESFRHQQSRYIIFYRIQHLLKKQFELVESQVDLRIFGSCATGLSLPTSDIDLGITGFECHPRSDLICILSTLANILEQFKWVKSIERIFTASIPIIKMEVDPFVDFKDSSNVEELSLFFDPLEIQQMNMPFTEENKDLQGIHLKVDITVECQMQTPNTEILNHMGFLSTDFVVRWMSYYIRLQPMTIVMKCFLHARNLNTNFKGGISSYCLLIMIIAFFRDNQSISQSDDYCNILSSFLKYYGNSFNPETTGISLVNVNPFFPCVRSVSQSKLQVIDPLTSKIMTQNTYLIDEILKEFQCFHNKLNDFSKKVEKQLDKMTYDQIERLDRMDYEEQKEELNILFEKNLIESIINEVDNSKTEFYEKVFKQEQLEHNKNTSIYKIQDPKQSLAETISTNTTTSTTPITASSSTTANTNTNPTNTQSTLTNNPKRSKNNQSKYNNNNNNNNSISNNQSIGNNINKTSMNRIQQKEQIQ